MSVIDSLLNDVSKETSSQKITILDLNEIMPNPLNSAPMINIEELAASIKENGLQNPLQVYKVRNHEYVLINGERRYRALKMNDMMEAAALIIPRPESMLMERILIMDANAQRDESIAYKKQRAKEYEEIYLDLKKQNLIPAGMLKIDWIGCHMGVTGRQVQRYLKETTIKKKQVKSPAINDLQKHIQSRLQTKVTIKSHSLQIQYMNEDDLNRILELLSLENIVNE